MSIQQSDLEAAFDFYLRTLARDLWEQVEREWCFAMEHAGRRYRFDFAFPPERVAIEIDGGQWLPHGGRHNRDSDRWKTAAAAAAGWKVLHFSGEMLESNPHRWIELVKEALSTTDTVALVE